MTVAVGAAIWILGLCVGSFLNVVAYRLPAGMSIAQPARSFCPSCRTPIAARDNIPLLSWFLLRGRCRSCRRPISAAYPLVEALCGLAFVLVYAMLFVERTRYGLDDPTLARDWPVLASWLTLTAALIACSVMDLRWYTVDVRVTNAALVAGIVLAALWPGSSRQTGENSAPLIAGAAAALLVCAAQLVRFQGSEPEAADHLPEERSLGGNTESGVSGAPIGALLLAAMAPAALAWLAFPQSWVIPAALVLIFLITSLAGGQARESDQEVEAAVEEESVTARRVALGELLWLAPAIVAGLIVGLSVAYVPSIGAAWSAATNWSVAGAPLLGGAVRAAAGATFAASAGWILRIVFTLVFGREAFGAGDIYILAAAGAAAGGDIALPGLLISVGLAMVGWTISLFVKRSVMIPFGPWMAIGFVAALWLNRPVHALFGAYRDAIMQAAHERPDVLMMGVGLLLVGSVLSVVVAKLVRRLAEGGR
ncbi:MAG: prepilin peptidase [Phycisphaerae bacterium]